MSEKELQLLTKVIAQNSLELELKQSKGDMLQHPVEQLHRGLVKSKIQFPNEPLARRLFLAQTEGIFDPDTPQAKRMVEACSRLTGDNMAFHKRGHEDIQSPPVNTPPKQQTLEQPHR